MISETGADPTEAKPGTPGRVLKRAEIIANQIRARIIRGELREGDTLPPEAQLLSSLGISRPTLREAFRILEAEQLISVMRGSRSGARVHQPHVEGASRYASFVLQSEAITIADLYEVRLAIEPYMARRAAEIGKAAAADRLDAEAAKLRAMVEAGQYIPFMKSLAEFHRVLAEVSRVSTLLFLTEMVQGMLARHQVQFFSRRNMPANVQRSRALAGIRSFERLADLIRRGDADAAEAHWRLHVTNANASWVSEGEGDRIVDAFD